MPRGRTIWERLEPISRDRELADTLRMALADPLWLLARQRQFGEFQGVDGGSPVNVRVDYEHDRLTRIELGERRRDYNAGSDAPLETLLERESIAAGHNGAPTLRLRADAGMQFLRHMHDALGQRSASTTPFKLPVPADFDSRFWLKRPSVSDREGRQAYDVLGSARDGSGETSTRALDGHTVFVTLRDIVPGIDDPQNPPGWSRITSSEGLPLPETMAHTSDAFRQAARGFVLWYAGLYSEPTEANDAWDSARLEYGMRASTGADSHETVYEVEDYRGGRLDWYHFTPLPAGASLDPQSSPPEDPPVITQLPTRAAFRGMPAPRLWQFEDVGVNLSAIDAASYDLARLFMLEFTLLAGNDWFLMPLVVPVGTLTRVKSLRITDTFGNPTDVRPTREQPTAGDWNMFMMQSPPHTERGLLLPPVLGSSLHSEYVEEVIYTRDEMANLLFGIEATFEGELGHPVDRSQFKLPGLSITAVKATGDPATAYIDFANEGDDDLALDGWTVRLEQQAGPNPLYTFNRFRLAPRAVVRLIIGGDAALDSQERLHAQESISLHADALVVHQS